MGGRALPRALTPSGPPPTFASMSVPTREHPLKVGIFGGASFVAGTLLRLLGNHPYVRVEAVTSETFPGQDLGATHGFLKGRGPVAFSGAEAESFDRPLDAIFFSKPHGHAARLAARLVDRGAVLIDLSSDFRFEDPAVYEAWYKTPHGAPELQGRAVYGLPELHREKLRTASVIATPGCYPTSVILGAAPLYAAGWESETPLLAHAISGVSGAGKSVEEAKMFLNVAQNVRPYNVGVHRHTPEIEQELSRVAGREVRALFVPHVGPYEFGILSTLYLRLREPKPVEAVRAYYREYYAGEPFVRVMEGLPELKDAVGTNFVDLGVTTDPRTGWTAVVAALDNVVKGAAGAAIQCMNLRFGLDEVEGLPFAEYLRKRS